MSDQARHVTIRYRYPLRAVVVVVAASLFFACDLVLGAIFVMPMVPLIPFFLSFILGAGLLVASALEYAVANRERY